MLYASRQHSNYLYDCRGNVKIDPYIKGTLHSRFVVSSLVSGNRTEKIMSAYISGPES